MIPHSEAQRAGHLPEATAFPYVDCAIGGLDQRNNVLRYEDYSPNGSVDCYTTFLRFPETLPAWAKSNGGSVRGYKGTAKATFVPVDFDCKEDPAKALEDTRRTLRRWEAAYDLPLDALRVYFSGYKGFSVEIPEELFGGFEPSCGIADKLKVLTGELLADSPTADMSIYNTLRLWRTPNTKNGKSGLYKIPLETHEWLNRPFEEIKNLAHAKREVLFTDPSEFEPVPDLVDLWASTEGLRRAQGEYKEPLDMAGILEGVDEGERDTTLFRAACKLRRIDTPVDLARRWIAEAARSCSPPFDAQRAIDKVDRAYRDYPAEGFEDLVGDDETDSGVYLRHIPGGFGVNKQSNESGLPIKTVEEVIEEAGESVPWVVDGLLARGALTDFSGLAKKGGKTTFWCHAIVAGARGEDHGGSLTAPAKYLYLTEQGSNFAQVLRESGLEDYSEHISIVQFKDVVGKQWDTLINQAAAEAHRRNLDVLVVDTFAVFAKLKGSEENDAGPVADRMRVLRLAAQKYNIAVLLIRHAGKDGTARGSSAFEAEADICASLSRPEGRHAPTVRKLCVIGRYGEWERNIQLKDGRYVSLGTDDNIEFKSAVRFVKATIPESPDVGMRKQELIDKRTDDDGGFSVKTLERALDWLVKQKEIGEKQLMHERGKPKVYWLAYKPPGGGGDDGGVYLRQTPRVYGVNESRPQNAPRLTEEATVTETDRLEAARQAFGDSNRLTLLRDQVASGGADPDALAGALAAQLGGAWKGWRDVARTLADEYGEEGRHA